MAFYITKIMHNFPLIVRTIFCYLADFLPFLKRFFIFLSNTTLDVEKPIFKRIILSTLNVFQNVDSQDP